MHHSDVHRSLRYIDSLTFEYALTAMNNFTKNLKAKFQFKTFSVTFVTSSSCTYQLQQYLTTFCM